MEVGVDIVKIPTLEIMLSTSGSTFCEMCWTPEELAYCQGSVSRLAARWAAKEAAMKALGKGIGQIDPIDIEITGSEGQRPTLRLRGSALEQVQQQEVDLAVSMSHDGDYAIAFVVATPRLAKAMCGDDLAEGGNDGAQ
ncbi:holo-ACP synthase [Mycolicibacterium sp.]|uniref:holo-ACP synthase n=1 Tax=Mycolicibacterium sp. TaxID=2320850 RepID=UPI0037C4F69C